MSDGICDVCGEPGTYFPGMWITFYGPDEALDGNEVMFEWACRGCYCPRHWETLTNAVIEHLNLPERYDRIDQDGRVAIEVELIKQYEKEHDE